MSELIKTEDNFIYIFLQFYFYVNVCLSVCRQSKAIVPNILPIVFVLSEQKAFIFNGPLCVFSLLCFRCCYEWFNYFTVSASIFECEKFAF